MDYNVSVIIPSYNRAYSIERALKSVFRQTYQPNEVILIDNYSTDNTKDIAQKFNKLIYVVEKNKGVSFARNKGIKTAKSSWIAFLDSDDEWLPNKLEKQIVRIQETKAKYNLIHTNENWYKDGKYFNQSKQHTKKGGEIFEECLKLCCISPSSSLLRKDLFNKYGYFDENLPVCEDYDLWLRITAYEKVLFIDEPLINKYGGHSDQLSKKFWGMDRFRVYALEKLIKSCTLEDKKLKLAYDILRKKIKILINGAKKRDNKKIIYEYEKKLLCLLKNQ